MRTNVSIRNYMWVAKYYRDLPIIGPATQNYHNVLRRIFSKTKLQCMHTKVHFSDPLSGQFITI